MATVFRHTGGPPVRLLRPGTAADVVALRALAETLRRSANREATVVVSGPAAQLLAAAADDQARAIERRVG